MSIRNSPLSPFSIGNNQWTNTSKIPVYETYAPYENNWDRLATPPVSNSSSVVNGSFPGREVPSMNGSLKGTPPGSRVRSSGGTGIYVQGEGSMVRREGEFDFILSEHYLVLKRYLSASLNDEKGNPKPNKARDKLLRLSPVQFLELSTDVFDELARRQQVEIRIGSNSGPPPPFLPPRDAFHPKRNQARQKLSTLPSLRFRDLATDVFYELERRLPSNSGENVAKENSLTLKNGISPTGNRLRRPSDTSSLTYSMRSESRNGPAQFITDSIPSPSPTNLDFGRPTPKVFQSSTIIPNKSTIIEDDGTGDDGEGDVEENDVEDGLLDSNDLVKNERSRAEENPISVKSYELQLEKSNELLSSMKDKLNQKDGEINRLIKLQSDSLTQINLEKKSFQELTSKIENKLIAAQSLNESLRLELDRVKGAHAESDRDLKAQIKELKLSELNTKESNPILVTQKQEESHKEDLRRQQKITEEVRLQAQEILKEMRLISDQSRLSNEREETLLTTIKKLEAELKVWRGRYVKVRTQLRTLRASSSDLAIQRDLSGTISGSDFTDVNGMVKDFNVIKFQISIDELLRDSRIEEPAKVMELMKIVVLNVHNIIRDITEATVSGRNITLEQKKLKFGVTVTTKNFITASKNFAVSKGLSPISLLDAAASHLSNSVIELLRSVKIRPASDVEVEDDESEIDLTSIEITEDTVVRKSNIQSILSPRADLRPESSRIASSIRLSTNSSMYSPINSSRGSEVTGPFSPSNTSWTNLKNSLRRSGTNGFGAVDMLSPMGAAVGFMNQRNELEELKFFLDDQTALLVQNVQSLVVAIRSELGITATGNSINAITDVVGKVINSSEKILPLVEDTKLRTRGESVIMSLATIRKRLIEAGVVGRQIADEGRDDDESESAWRTWNQSLPPIAFGLAHEMKELVVQVDAMNFITTDNENKISSPKGNFNDLN